jgi:periplasmic copper chaperone A
MRVPLTVTARIVACGAAAALALVGCAAGQITQTDSQVSAVNGTSGNAGNAIALDDALIPYPPNQQGVYPAGSAVPVLLTIINQAQSPEQLIAVTSPAASQVSVSGITQIPPGSMVIGTSGALPVTGRPASPLVAGELHIVLTTNRPLYAGLNTPVSFQFRNAGTVTLLVPMGTPPNAASSVA